MTILMAEGFEYSLYHDTILNDYIIIPRQSGRDAFRTKDYDLAIVEFSFRIEKSTTLLENLKFTPSKEIKYYAYH